MIKAEIINSFIDVEINPMLVYDHHHKQGTVRYTISLSDAIHPIVNEAEQYNNIEIDIFGSEALVQLADALTTYINNMKLRDSAREAADI
ncbi:MAG: hypothetical protein HDR49_00185 [Bacteroides sp.]|nr:hypothetical protein [Bacteroides sp.]